MTNRKVLLVTGAGRGIGAATAQLAAARGYAVCVNYLNNREAAEAVVNAITQAGGRAIAIAADVRRKPKWCACSALWTRHSAR